MADVSCSVCNEPVEGKAWWLGSRSFCEQCYRKSLHNRRGVWWASLAGIAALVAFVALVAIMARQANPNLQGTALLIAGVILALVPALIWLAFFYLQDVREPEPKGLVLEVFLIGALLARAVGIPIIDGLFRTSEWIATSPLIHILGSILVVGFTQQFLVYAAVRYSVYHSSEFDERVDGIIYATAAALGYATMVNMQYVMASGGVDLVAGVIRITVTAMAFASFGGIFGYFLGRSKFEDEPAWWLPSGLILAAVLDGLFGYLRGEITSTRIGLSGGGFNPWPGLLLGAAVAGTTFLVLLVLIRRLERRTPQALGA